MINYKTHTVFVNIAEDRKIWLLTVIDLLITIAVMIWSVFGFMIWNIGYWWFIGPIIFVLLFRTHTMRERFELQTNALNHREALIAKSPSAKIIKRLQADIVGYSKETDKLKETNKALMWHIERQQKAIDAACDVYKATKRSEQLPLDTVL